MSPQRSKQNSGGGGGGGGGGVGVYNRKSLKIGIKEWRRHSDDVVASFTIDKTLLVLGHDVHIGCVDIVPEYFTY